MHYFEPKITAPYCWDTEIKASVPLTRLCSKQQKGSFHSDGNRKKVSQFWLKIKFCYLLKYVPSPWLCPNSLLISMWDTLRFEHWSLNCEYWFPRWVTHAPNSVGAQTSDPKFVPKAPSTTGPTTQNKWAKEEVCWQSALNVNVLIFYEKRGISPSDNSGAVFSLLSCIPSFPPVSHWDSNWHCFWEHRSAAGGFESSSKDVLYKKTQKHQLLSDKTERNRSFKKETSKTKLLMPLH